MVSTAQNRPAIEAKPRSSRRYSTVTITSAKITMLSNSGVLLLDMQRTKARMTEL